MKKRMRAWFSLLLCLLMLMTGCPISAEETADISAASESTERETVTEPKPTAAPTSAPEEKPTAPPTEAPTEVPTQAPTEEPTAAPTEEPTAAPTEEPTAAPTEEPAIVPTEGPEAVPTEAPTEVPPEEGIDEPAETPAAETTAAPAGTQMPTETDASAETPEPTVYPGETPEPETTETPAPTVAAERYAYVSTGTIVYDGMGEVLGSFTARGIVRLTNEANGARVAVELLTAEGVVAGYVDSWRVIGDASEETDSLLPAPFEPISADMQDSAEYEAADADDIDIRFEEYVSEHESTEEDPCWIEIPNGEGISTYAFVQDVNASMLYVRITSPFIMLGQKTTFEVVTGGFTPQYYAYKVYRVTQLGGGYTATKISQSDNVKTNRFSYTFNTPGEYYVQAYAYVDATHYAYTRSEHYQTVSEKEADDPETVYGRIKQIVAEYIVESMSDFEKANVLHDWLVMNVTYGDTTEIHTNKVEGALLYGDAVCNSFARAYQMLLAEVGIECLEVIDWTGDSDAPSGHEWNLVKIGGDWFHVDCTWDSYYYQLNGRKNYYSFLNDETCAIRHGDYDTWNDSVSETGTLLDKLIASQQIIPEADSTIQTHMYKNADVTFSSAAELRAGLMGIGTHPGYLYAYRDGSVYISETTVLNTVNECIQAGAFGQKGVTASITALPFNMFSIALAYHPTQVSVGGGTAETEIGKPAFTLPVTIEPSYATLHTDMTWTSSNPQIASVDRITGEITPIAPGKVTITARTSNAIEGTCELTVKETVTSLTAPATRTIAVGYTGPLGSAYEPSYAPDTRTYSSSGKSIVTVDAEGNITGMKAGTANITVTMKTPTKTWKTVTKVTVKAKPSKITLDKTSVTMMRTTTKTLKATLPSGTWSTKTWTSSDTYVATVDGSGVITANHAGTAVITVSTYNGKTASCTVTVQEVPESMTLAMHEIITQKGKSGTVAVTFEPENAYRAVKWATSNKKVATVDSKGKIKAVAKGTCTITCTSANGLVETIAMTVYNVPTKVTLGKTSLPMTLGDTYTLSGKVSPSGADPRLTWTSSYPDIASVEDGVITAHALGKTNITARTVNGKKATCTVTVYDVPERVELNRTEGKLVKGKTGTLKARVYPATGNPNIKWTSSDPSVAKVSSSGKVVGKGYGTAVITATTVNGLTAECLVTVSYAATSVKLEKSSVVMMLPDEPLTLNVKVSPARASDSLLWSSSDTSVVTVKDGVLTPVGTGTAKIKAKAASGKYATCKVTVFTVPTSAEIINTPLLVMKGSKATLALRMSPEGGDTRMQWTSSDPTIASVSNGTVNGLKTGTVTVTAVSAHGPSCEAEVIVYPKPTSIKVSKSSIKLHVGETYAMTAAVKPYADSPVKWVSASTKYAKVSSDGVITAVKTGTVKVAAKTANGLKAYVTVTIVK